MRAIDQQQNRIDLGTEDLAGAGFQSFVDVLSNEDSAPPQFSELSLEPSEVNVHDGAQTVRIPMMSRVSVRFRPRSTTTSS